ncbi:MAG: TfoX/Sxy family protein [Elusimicrobiota bacterium]|nr:TfoX/Sxy family protein [Elusimicrobiota bacterium]
MGTSQKTVESLSKALALVPEVSFLPMMGEYSICSRGRMFAVVCNDELFLKTSPETLCLFRDKETRPYPGSTTMFKANAEWLEDPEKLGEVVLYTLASHPPPGPPGGARGSNSRPAARRLQPRSQGFSRDEGPEVPGL